jgi:uncharacterized membrane protein YdjX (TVP38/TMEM64 family)
MIPRWRIVLPLAVLVLLLGLGTWLVTHSSIGAVLNDPDRLHAAVDSIGPFGPLAVIFGLAAAVVVSPIPSAPIAVAAGAAYGTVWGTLYVVLGAELGALMAFGLARYLGFDVVRRWPWAAQLLDGVTSQAALAAIVFGSRLVPFLSFDAVSYAAGLTRLRWDLFALATLAGVVPVSLLLAWFGDSMVLVGAASSLWIALLLGAVTLVPIAAGALQARRKTAQGRHRLPPTLGDGRDP